MYGDTGVMRKRAAQLREQGEDIRAMADLLAGQMEGLAWTGRAADAMRERIGERAAHLRDVAGRHDLAADSLERHVAEVDALKEQIATTERRADALVTDALARRTATEHAHAGGRLPAPEDHSVAFDPPPPGHKGWLGVELPGRP